eukprot:NODE_719_length_4493_cov_0.423987.p1 type:complete len:810 gc:universal NODE_719_length_4493_cov_0.423987:748-3177(+)
MLQRGEILKKIAAKNTCLKVLHLLSKNTQLLSVVFKLYNTKFQFSLVLYFMTLCDVTFSLSNQLNQLYTISTRSQFVDMLEAYLSVGSLQLTDTTHRILTPSEWQIIEFPIMISEMPCDVKLILKFKNVMQEISVFNENKLLRNGHHSINFGDKTFPKLQILESKLRQYERGEIERDSKLDGIIIQKVQDEMDSFYLKDNFVCIQFPLFKFPVIYNEEFVENKSQYFSKYYDPEIYLDNIIEEKHRRLARGTRSGFVDKSLKPNSNTRDEIARIIQLPSTKQLNSDERDLIWTFRYYLLKNRAACSKFIKSVYWNDAFESKQAMELLSQWEEILIADALELLGSDFEDIFIRKFAIDRLEKANDTDLSMYLIQLIQAIKYEHFKQGSSRQSAVEIVNFLNSSVDTDEILYSSPLVRFLTDKCCSNEELVYKYYWYIKCEESDSKYGLLFQQLEQFVFKNISNQDIKDTIRRQRDIVKYLCSISSSLKLSKEQRLRKIEWLQEALADPKNGLNVFPSMKFLLDSEVVVTGIVPDKASLFKSQLMPLKLTFTCDDGGVYPCIFKMGDDMRQDQLALQLIRLMDNLLIQDNLDLKILTYNVLAVSEKVGLAEFIESKPLSEILDKNNGLLAPYLLPPNCKELPAQTMDTFLRSSAGYCVMTFILGVGDRHLDNLLLTKEGRLFHVDYAYILGLDPKPFPPSMKICREMLDLMGGINAPNYVKFKQYCFTAYNILRNHSNLIIHLFSLMKDANLPSIQIDPDQSIIKIQEKFRMDLNEKEATEYFDQLITESATALAPQVIESIHRFAQYWRR